jgi:signal transduction histidine kinase
MNGPGHLSLRARLLVVLIAVTAAFLLVMGGVTAFVLSRRLGAQFDDGLISAAARTPVQIQANPGDYVAVEVTRLPLTVQPLTGSTGTTAELASAVERIVASGNIRGYIKDTPFTVPGTTPRLRAVARPVRATGTRPDGGRRLFAVLVVARPVGVVTGQVGGIVVAELITGGALILLLALGGRWLIGRGLAPLSEMAGTAQRITTQGDLTARMPDADTSTEVGRLGAAINTMLDRIQQAFGARLRSEHKVRQFAADASHELRTPLTTIRGYAELYRQGALGDSELPDAMRRIEQEARRMGTLVAELLELARLDRTSSLDLTETDLSALVRDAVADARAVEPARPVRAEAPDCLVAAVDEARIRQVLANLLGNVREHTPVTTAAAVRLAQVRAGVVLEVADAGPGMADGDAARAFDRFYRGAERHNGGSVPGPAVGYGPGSARAASHDSGNGSGDAGESGGSGLGLAIVAAIAQAHGGQATLESAPGHGTRVQVWLPATPAAPAAAPRPASTPRLSPASRAPVPLAAPPPVRPLPRPPEVHHDRRYGPGSGADEPGASSAGLGRCSNR